ncbi:asparagine synthase (glutamine-hydrolysing) [Plasticicumulans lactativorans]|uniref:Asparagine synthase (Glutamine-hydrolysing) n=1 Tax=Plasticicumulans lactativorans TaxID=1133106 RepID=A0A4R2L855_9GAMM|nr:hypothetical protein [Plasticicumulans lactativorans]TCO80236.1 asparagine synthase (glutamine-hydrolysing) [Plasticicumulans lactativorans]
MGQFIVSRRDASPPLRPVPTDPLASHGFGAPARLATADHDILVHGKLNGLPPVVVHAPDGSGFAVQTGTFYYRGQAGAAGLAALLADFDGTTFPWADCIGHYAVLLYRGGRLYLANDALGAYKVYHDAGGRVYASAFTAVQQRLPRVTPDPQGVYEYAWNGAGYGDKTFCAEIRMLRRGQLLALDAPPRVLAEAALTLAEGPADFEDTAQRCAARLRAVFAVYAGAGGRFRTALSGGYDSRLLLALLLDAGLDPQLFVYGDAADDDVVIAKTVAAGEGLAIDHIDKRSRGVAAEDWPAAVAHGHACFDGWKNDGLFDNGADAHDRLARATDDTIVLNGSVGEIFRNFFYLPQRRYALRELVWSFYSRYAPAACTGAFDVRAFEDAMIADMQAAIGVTGPRVTRAELEALYPLYRGRYWTARDVGLNQRFGRMLFPFMEAGVIAGMPGVPVAYKNYGRLEARIIEIIRPSLARHTTSYGFAPATPAPFAYRLKMATTLWRPTWLRRYSYRLQYAHRRGERPAYLRDERLRQVMDPTLPVMRAFFRPEHVHDADAYNRIATMDYLFQTHGG